MHQVRFIVFIEKVLNQIAKHFHRKGSLNDKQLVHNVKAVLIILISFKAERMLVGPD